jgi:hypothetical protein
MFQSMGYSPYLPTSSIRPFIHSVLRMSITPLFIPVTACTLLQYLMFPLTRAQTKQLANHKPRGWIAGSDYRQKARPQPVRIWFVSGTCSA